MCKGVNLLEFAKTKRKIRKENKTFRKREKRKLSINEQNKRKLNRIPFGAKSFGKM